MGHIYLSHSHPIAIYACPIPFHGRFPWDSHRNGIPMDMPGHRSSSEPLRHTHRTPRIRIRK